MKIKALLLPIIICLIVECGQQNFKTPLSPMVDSVVTKFIKTRAKKGLIYLVFDKIGNKDYLIIRDLETYDDRFVDGYFYYEGKTIAYCSYDTTDRSNLLNPSKTTIFKGSIPGYCSETQMMSNYVSEKEMYEMKSPTNFIKVNNITFPFKKAIDTNGIVSKTLNNTINRYINEHHTQTCLIAFKKSDTSTYMLLMSSLFYQKEHADYYFYRNDHPVILYNAKGIDFLNVYDIQIFKGKIPGIRGVPLREFWYGTTPQLFLITPDYNVVGVDDRRIIREIIDNLKTI